MGQSVELKCAGCGVVLATFVLHSIVPDGDPGADHRYRAWCQLHSALEAVRRTNTSYYPHCASCTRRRADALLEKVNRRIEQRKVAMRDLDHLDVEIGFIYRPEEDFTAGASAKEKLLEHRRDW